MGIGKGIMEKSQVKKDAVKIGRKAAAKAGDLAKSMTDKSQLKKAAKKVARVAAKVGYLAKGIMWLLMGVLTLQAALGISSTRVDQNVVLLRLFAQPFGHYALIAMALGLAGYAIWRALQAFFDPDDHGKDFSGLANRIGYFVTALGYVGMAFAAIELSMGMGSGGSSEQTTRSLTAQALTHPLGIYLVGIVGVFITGLGLYQVYLGISTRFERDFEHQEMTPEERRWAIRIGRYGYISRSIIFATIGIIFIHAALRYSPEEVGFFGQALRSLSDQPYGVYIIGVLGVGLMAHGLYALVLARYRRINW
jgi:hypothetical protein